MAFNSEVMHCSICILYTLCECAVWWSILFKALMCVIITISCCVYVYPKLFIHWVLPELHNTLNQRKYHTTDFFRNKKESHLVYKLAANTMSLLMREDASIIFWRRVGSPITWAALRTSLQVSSKRWMQRTMIPTMGKWTTANKCYSTLSYETI